MMRLKAEAEVLSFIWADSVWCCQIDAHVDSAMGGFGVKTSMALTNPSA